MIASHNIKVNGRWIRSGEEYGEQKAVENKPKSEPKVQEEVAEPVATETAKPKTARRKVSK